MKIGKYLRKFKITQGYKDWFARFARINAAYNAKYIKPEQLEGFQLFLLQTGQFNANFTLEELDRLKYPKSPFAMMHTNDYLRCVDSWAMEILRVLYREDEHLSKCLYPIWVDSILIGSELKRYCGVKLICNYDISFELVEEIYKEFQANSQKLRVPILFSILKPEDSTIVEHEQSIKKKFIDRFQEHILKSIAR